MTNRERIENMTVKDFITTYRHIEERHIFEIFIMQNMRCGKCPVAPVANDYCENCNSLISWLDKEVSE